MFTLDEEQTKKLNAWLEEHKKECNLHIYSGAIGGRLTYSFSPTSIGVVCKVDCSCGKGIDLSDYENW